MSTWNDVDYTILLRSLGGGRLEGGEMELKFEGW